jgi:hypothetical protein
MAPGYTQKQRVTTNCEVVMFAVISHIKEKARVQSQILLKIYADQCPNERCYSSSSDLLGHSQLANSGRPGRGRQKSQ